MTSRLERSLHLFQEFGYSAREFCVTGSSALELISSVAKRRKLAPLLLRTANDVDIFSLRHAFDHTATNEHLQAYHKLGIDECLNIDMGESSFDMTCRWPFILSHIETPDQLAGVCHEIDGLLVMHEEHIAVLKERFGRQKDIEDLRQMEIARGNVYKPLER